MYCNNSIVNNDGASALSFESIYCMQEHKIVGLDDPLMLSMAILVQLYSPSRFVLGFVVLFVRISKDLELYLLAPAAYALAGQRQFGEGRQVDLFLELYDCVIVLKSLFDITGLILVQVPPSFDFIEGVRDSIDSHINLVARHIRLC